MRTLKLDFARVDMIDHFPYSVAVEEFDGTNTSGQPRKIRKLWFFKHGEDDPRNRVHTRLMWQEYPKREWMGLQEQFMIQERKDLGVEGARQLFAACFPMYQLDRVWWVPSWNRYDIHMSDPNNVCIVKDLYW